MAVIFHQSSGNRPSATRLPAGGTTLTSDRLLIRFDQMLNVFLSGWVIKKNPWLRPFLGTMFPFEGCPRKTVAEGIFQSPIDYRTGR